MNPTHVRCVESNEQHLTKGKVYRIILTRRKKLVIINADDGNRMAIFMPDSCHGKFRYIHPSVKNPK